MDESQTEPGVEPLIHKGSLNEEIATEGQSGSLPSLATDVDRSQKEWVQAPPKKKFIPAFTKKIRID